MSKLETIKYQGNDYATVPVRLKEFREKNPRSAVTTTPLFGEDGSLTFKAEIVTDKGDEHSASATGHAHYSAKEMETRKAFEKLETVATGRALALLGYLNNGQVATTEEMLEFEQHKLEKFEEAIETAETGEELMALFGKMNANEKKDFTEKLSLKKKELLDATANK